MGKSGVNSSVPPSGSAFLTKSTEARAAAPGLFSTITDEANGTRMRSASTRAMMSVPPPAGKPTTRRSRRFVSWAKAQVPPAKTAVERICASKRRRVCMVRLPSCLPNLLRLEAGVFHHLLGDHPILPDLGREFLGRVDRRDEAARIEVLLEEGGGADHLGELDGELVDDRPRRAGRHEQAVPALRRRPVITGLLQGRHLGKLRR